MVIGHAYDDFRAEVNLALVSKLEEFHILGYDSVSQNELWGYLTKKKWRKPKEDIHIYEIIADILAVKVSDFISFATIESYKSPEFSLDDEHELKELLK